MDKFYVKFKSSLFSDPRVIYLRHLENGNEMALMLVMLLMLSRECSSGGYLRLTGEIYYDAKMLSDEFDLPIEVVKEGLKQFERLGFIKDYSGIIRVLNWEDIIFTEEDRGSPEYRAWKKSVMERDRYLCQHCGAKAADGITLHAHHIKSWKDYPSLRFDVKNGIALCGDCHRKIHSMSFCGE